MSNPVLNSKSVNTTPWSQAADTLRDLIAAMPIVIFANALRAALQRPAAARAPLRTSELH